VTRSGGDPAAHLSIDELSVRKRSHGLSVSVCLPALNEQSTVGEICRRIVPLLEGGLVDQLAVIDSGSTDATIETARSAGAEVFKASELMRHVHAPGKGGTLWKSLSIATGDVVMWLDSDTRNFSETFVTHLLAPFLDGSTTRLTKAFYDRPLADGKGGLTAGGARVTELVVRPLAHLLFPELAIFVQPLSGEYAAYREDLISLPFFSGYGVEVGLLIDFIERHGSGCIQQVDLGARVHNNQDLLALGRMAFEVLQVMTTRAEDMGRVKLGVPWPVSMTQFTTAEGEASPVSHQIELIELPPLRTLL
jgi:glucosyl-3-phosphoglycerate synthase